jgi:cytochrome c oxidase subunit II
MNPRRPAIGVIATLAMLAIAGFGLALWASRTWFPPVASEHAPGIQRMVDYTTGATGALFVVGHLSLAALIWRFSRSGGTMPRKLTLRREWLLALGPAALMAGIAEGGVLVLGLPVFEKYYGKPPADSVPVEVVAQQFRWIARYPGGDASFGKVRPELIRGENYIGLDTGEPAAKDDVISVGEMVVPVGRPIVVSLRSTDVIHSFFVPELRVKQDAMPGMAIRLWFRPTKVGEYEIACNQICGLGHYTMKGSLRVVPPGEYEAWLREMGPAAPALSGGAS